MCILYILFLWISLFWCWSSQEPLHRPSDTEGHLSPATRVAGTHHTHAYMSPFILFSLFCFASLNYWIAQPANRLYVAFILPSSANTYFFRRTRKRIAFQAHSIANADQQKRRRLGGHFATQTTPQHKTVKYVQYIPYPPI